VSFRAGLIARTAYATGPAIALSNFTVAENATIGTTIGTLSVVGGTGTYSFTLTDSAGGKFTTAGTNGTNLNTAGALDYETATFHMLMVSATNGVDTIVQPVAITVTNVVEDTTPNAFSFTDVTGATTSTAYESNAITVAGIDGPATMTITGGEYQINGGTWASTSTTVVATNTVKVRGTSSPSGLTAVNVVLTIGGVSDTYTITTASGPTAPANTVPPTIDDTTPTVGQMLTASPGTWTGTPTPTYAYQWIRGVADILPVNTEAPAITGSTTVGATLTLADGTWTGTPTPVITRQWKSGAANVGTGTGTYVTVAGDVGANISAVVTGTNAAGAVNANSNSVGPIIAAAASTKLNTTAGTWLGVDFTNGDLTITCNTAGGGSFCARSVASHSSGKFYCEVLINVHITASLQAGIANAAEPLAYPIGVYGNDGIAALDDGGVYLNGVTPANTPVAVWTTAGEIRRIAVDFDNKLIWFATNNGVWNVTGGNPTDPTATGKGASFSTINAGPYFLKLATAGVVGQQLTVNFGGTAYTYSPPAGYGNW
jgi:hypothetical protein